MPERISNLLRVVRMFTPRFSAYRAPNSNAFKGFTSNRERPREMIINDANIGNRSNVTPEKLPNPHITKECTPSWVEKKLSRDIADDDKLLTNIPIINSIIELFTIDENASRVSMIMPAPSSAPARILTYEPKLCPIEPPSASITIATPRLDPVETPSIDGPARGLSKVVCNNSPATDRAAPASVAVQAIGKRVSRIIISHVLRVASLPIKMLSASLNGMFTLPIIRHAGNRIKSNVDKIHNAIFERLYFGEA